MPVLRLIQDIDWQGLPYDMDYAARIVNKYRRILLCSVFLLLVLSCNEDVSDYSAPKLKKVVEDPKIEYIGDVLPFNKIDNIFRYKDRLYVIAYHHKQKNYLHVYDVNDGTHLYSSLHQGNAPDDGSLICSIGHMGKVPSEYISVDNIQVAGDRVIVYSQGGKVLEFDLAGKLISTSEISGLGNQSYKVGDQYLTYRGYLRSGDSRLQLISQSSVIEDYLVTDNAVMPLSKISPIFEETKSGVAVLDSWSPVVYQYHKGELQEYLRFNFGKYSIGEDFFNSANPMEGVMSLMKSQYAIISKYFEFDRAKIVEVDVVTSGRIDKRYAYTRGSDWRWFSLGTPGNSPMAGGLVGIDEDYLYILLNPMHIDDLDESIKSKITNPDVLDNVDEEGNYILAKLEYI